MIRNIPYARFPKKTATEMKYRAAKKNHRAALARLRDVRSRASEFEKTQERGFKSYQSAAIGAANNQFVQECDKGKLLTRIEYTVYSLGEGFHEINGNLDSLIILMEDIREPIPQEVQGNSFITNIAHAEATVNVALLVGEIDKQIATTDDPVRKGKLEKLRDFMSGATDIAQIVKAIIDFADLIHN
ncbi:MAG: hypothetical protein WCV86_00905 [Patescibacteria group bacterium]|jgi:hypothetical protein